MSAITKINSDMFSFDKSKLMFTAEASSMPQLLTSFYIKSVKTGNVRLFVYARENRDSLSGAVQSWTFICLSGGMTAVIFND